MNPKVTAAAGMAKKTKRTAITDVSTHGANISAAMKPSTTDGSEAIISIAGLITARICGCMNSLT